MKQSSSEVTEDSPGTGSPQASSGKENGPDDTPVPKGYVFINSLRCKGCGFCVAFCPQDVLKMGDEINEKGYILPLIANPANCNGCNNCGLFCPDFAIFGIRSGKKKRGGNASSSSSSCDNGE